MNLLYKMTIPAATLVALLVTAPINTPTHVNAVSASAPTTASTLDDLPPHHIAPRVTTAPKPKPRPHRASRSRFAPVKTAPSHTAVRTSCGSNWRGSLSYAEAWIIQRESGFSTTDPNPNSTAFGLGQLLDYNRATYGRKLGVSPDTTDPCAQIAMFRMYVADRYGNADNAMAFWRVHSWY